MSPAYKTKHPNTSAFNTKTAAGENYFCRSPGLREGVRPLVGDAGRQEAAEDEARQTAETDQATARRRRRVSTIGPVYNKWRGSSHLSLGRASLEIFK